jgi:hypothetical protein
MQQAARIDRSRKNWRRLAAFTLFMFVCHGGALLVFLPRILGRFGIGPVFVIAVFSLLCWTALVLLLLQYKQRILPINETIEALIHDRPPLFPPQSIVKICRELRRIGENICSIQKKSRAAGDYIRILGKNKGGNGAGGLIEKQKEYSKYFNNAYAEYGSLDLNIRFQFYISLVKEIIIPEEVIHRLDIERFIEALKTDLKSRLDVLMAYNPGTEDATDFSGIKKTVKVIQETIPRIASYLISAQSSNTIAGTSPLDEQNLLDIYYQKGYGVETAFEQFEHLKKLDDEHDRFMAEQELTERRSGSLLHGDRR